MKKLVVYACLVGSMFCLSPLSDADAAYHQNDRSWAPTTTVEPKTGRRAHMTRSDATARLLETAPSGKTAAKAPLNLTPNVTDPKYGSANGLLGLNRNIILKVLGKCQLNVIRVVIGVCTQTWEYTHGNHKWAFDSLVGLNPEVGAWKVCLIVDDLIHTCCLNAFATLSNDVSSLERWGSDEETEIGHIMSNKTAEMRAGVFQLYHLLDRHTYRPQPPKAPKVPVISLTPLDHFVRYLDLTQHRRASSGSRCSETGTDTAPEDSVLTPEDFALRFDRLGQQTFRICRLSPDPHDNLSLSECQLVDLDFKAYHLLKLDLWRLCEAIKLSCSPHIGKRLRCLANTLAPKRYLMCRAPGLKDRWPEHPDWDHLDSKAQIALQDFDIFECLSEVD
ncbi:hypothetical protein FACS189472_02230 [Alphaproteobacteria bacterium]|nr:hypothetical protein FACS189472_02230 [Alphaproteobacteria bacterium]